MTEKRFKQVLGGIKDTESNRLLKTPMGLMLQYADVFNNCIEWLNELQEENEQLKQAYQTLKHRHSLLHDVCIEAECDRDRYHKDVVSLEKENGQLIPFLNIARDYNLTLDQLYEILEETLEEK